MMSKNSHAERIAAQLAMAEETEEISAEAGPERVSSTSDHCELKRRLAALIGADPSRYRNGRGVERHKRMTESEVDAVCEALGIGFVDGTVQTKRDTVMLKLGRDHRTGFTMWDSSDLIAIIERLEGRDSDE